MSNSSLRFAHTHHSRHWRWPGKDFSPTKAELLLFWKHNQPVHQSDGTKRSNALSGAEANEPMVSSCHQQAAPLIIGSKPFSLLRWKIKKFQRTKTECSVTVRFFFVFTQRIYIFLPIWSCFNCETVTRKVPPEMPRWVESFRNFLACSLERRVENNERTNSIDVHPGTREGDG